MLAARSGPRTNVRVRGVGTVGVSERMATWRRWSDLSLGRVARGALLAPVPATYVVVWNRAAVWFLLTLLLWSFWLTLGYVLGAARWRQKITRIECILLGLLIGWTWQFASDSARNLLPGAWLHMLRIRPVPHPFAFIMRIASDPMVPVVEALFLAIGLFTGWLFWRLAIRPAPQPFDVTVFD